MTDVYTHPDCVWNYCREPERCGLARCCLNPRSTRYETQESLPQDTASPIASGIKAIAMTDTLVERMTASEIADRVLILSASFNAGKVGRQTCDLAYAKLKAQDSRIAELEGLLEGKTVALNEAVAKIIDLEALALNQSGKGE